MSAVGGGAARYRGWQLWDWGVAGGMEIRGLQAYPFQNSVCVLGMIHGAPEVRFKRTSQPAKDKRTFLCHDEIGQKLTS